MLPDNDPYGQDERPNNDQNRPTNDKKPLNDRYHYQPNGDSASNSSTSSFNNSFAQRQQPNPYIQRNSRPHYQNNGYNRFNYSYNNNNNNNNNHLSASNNYGSNDNFSLRPNPSSNFEKPKGNPIKIERPTSTPIIQGDNIKKKTNININIGKNSNPQIRIEHRMVTHSLSDEIKLSNKAEPKIKIQKVAQEGKSFIISSGDAKSEICPFCGNISLPFQDLLNHIISAHKLMKIFEDTFRSSKNPEQCSKCNIDIDDNQLLKHCLEKHHQIFFEMIRDKCIPQFESRRSEIEAFIEKHEPNINPRYSRNVEISSSNSSEDDEDSFPIDEDYERFAASSIDTSGLATQKAVTQKPVTQTEPKFDPSKIEINKNETKTESSKNIISLFADYETFLRNYNLFQVSQNNTFTCILCKKKFDTVIRLVEHSLQQHRLRISQEIRRALCTMKKNVTYDMDERELMKMTGLNLDLTLKDIPRVNPKETPPYVLNDVPQVLVDMMLEVLSFIQPVVNSRHTPKIFSNTTLIMVRLPAPLPVLFTSEVPGSVTLGFLDTGPLDGERIRNIANETLNCLNSQKIIDAYFQNMDSSCGFTNDDLNDLMEDFDIHLLKTDDHINPDGTRSFSIAIMIPKWSKATINDIDREMKRLFEVAKMTVCKKCHEPFNVNNNTECEGPKANGLTIKVKGRKHDPERVISEYELNEIALGDWNPEIRYSS